MLEAITHVTQPTSTEMRNPRGPIRERHRERLTNQNPSHISQAGVSVNTLLRANHAQSCSDFALHDILRQVLWPRKKS